MVTRNQSLVLDPEALVGTADTPLLRELQLAEIRTCYQSPLARTRPLHLWVSGPSGTGKTLCVRHLLDTEVAAEGVLPIYVTCRDRFTFLDMVEQILEHDHRVIEPRRTRERQVALLRETIGRRRCVIALDDLDTLRLGDIVDLLHHLCSLPQTVLICIASVSLPTMRLPPAILSRFAPRQVQFPRYDRSAIIAILQRTVEQALRPGCCQEQALQKIADHAHGDARRGLALLRHAIQRAVDAGSPVLAPAHLVPANFAHFRPRVEDELATLSTHHRILYDLVSLRGPLTAPQLEAAYRSLCQHQDLPPASPRTLNKYLNILCRKRLLRREHGPGTGAWIYRRPSSLSLR